MLACDREQGQSVRELKETGIRTNCSLAATEGAQRSARILISYSLPISEYHLKDVHHMPAVLKGHVIKAVEVIGGCGKSHQRFVYEPVTFGY